MTEIVVDPDMPDREFKCHIEYNLLLLDYIFSIAYAVCGTCHNGRHVILLVFS